ncbi:hypothetical protein B9Z55_014266 [Caenorhabditis nigoni]|uniref:HECT-type E3 ubiquitin transferase n=1 Tax=Caenorhabditis nigoni TaxID=1611254 RepID=A0A2G5U588_9PELO|nr:hypothetical protein B9Z55_014266 [Caenorhabditis nigoni]
MRIDDEPSSSSNSTEMPPASATLLQKINDTFTDEDFIEAINKGREVHAVMGKTELHRWIDVLNRCDEILEKAVQKNDQGNMKCDHDATLKNYAVAIIRFTVLLFECTSSRRIYKSVDRILALLESTDMDLLAEVLRLLQVMGKRSKFLSTRIPQKDQQSMANRLTAIAQCWGGKLRTVKMAECLKKDPKLPLLFPFSYTDSKQRTIVVEQPQNEETVGELITRTVAQLSPPTNSETTTTAHFSNDDLYCLLSRIRMHIAFDDWHHRFKCLIVRLLSVSTLVYCRLGGTDESTLSSLLYSGFIEEIVELLKTEREADTQTNHNLHDAIQTEALSTLCSIVTYEKEPKVPQILDALSASSYHGFLSVMTRQIVDELKSNNLGKPGKPSVSLATSLFSFIYHLASIEPGGDTLVSSGLTQTLLSVIGYHDLPIECITFGTRCARIIDLFTTLDVTAFKANNGMEICVNRVVHEINECRKEQPFMIDVSHDMPFDAEPEPRDDHEQDEQHEEDQQNMEEDGVETSGTPSNAPVQEMEEPGPAPEADVVDSPNQAGSSTEKFKGGPWEVVQSTGTTCHQQRSGLIKGLLTFIKRAIGDGQFQDIMKHIMEGDLPEALMHILSNAEYYSPSLFHQSAHLITNFVYQFPEELSSIQRRHVPYVVFQSLLRKEVRLTPLPNSKDVITTLGNVFTAMCLNERGLRQFKSYEPFNQIFRIVLSVKFLVTLRKKRTSDVFESAQAIGGALDDLMRHYPDLKHDMLKSIIVILDLLHEIGKNPPDGVELVPTLTKSMARNIVFSPNMSFLVPREVRSQANQQREEPEQADEQVGGDVDEEPMEVEDGEDSDVDEEDNEMSMDETSGDPPEPAAPSPAPQKNRPFEYGPGMMCEDVYGKKMLPIGDYMLLVARVVETMMTQTPTQKITEEFIEGRVMQKIMRLCHLPCPASDATQTAYLNSISAIIKHIVKAGFHGQRTGPDAGPKLMSAIIEEFIKTIDPFFEMYDKHCSVLQKDGIKNASLFMTLDDKILEKTLLELNSIIPALLHLNKTPMNSSNYNPPDHRNRIFETWKMPDGMKLYAMLRKLSRMLCWEHELIQTLKPTIRTAATQTEGEMLSDGPSDAHLDMEVLPPWEEDDIKEKRQQEQDKDHRWKAAGVSQAEHEFWSHHKSLQETVCKSHNAVKELLNSMGRQANVNNPRRIRTREAPTLPAASTQCISMIFTSIYKDLKWEPPVQSLENSPMAYGRYTDLLAQLNYALFEGGNRCASASLAQNFYTSGCHKAFFELFTEKIVPYLGENMPEGVENAMEEWCRLAGKLTDRNALVNPDGIQQRRDRQITDFDTVKYLKLVCRDMFHAYKQFFEKMAQMPDWELKSLKKVCESAFSVFKEVAKNLVEEAENSPAPAAASGNANAPDAPPEEWAPGIPRPAQPPAEAPPAPQAPDAQDETIRMLMDLGFSRDIVLYALENTRNADEAANYLLAQGQEIRIQDVVNAFRDDNDDDDGIQFALRALRPIVPTASPSANELENMLRDSLANRQGYELVRTAQRTLRDANMEQVADQLVEIYPDESAAINADNLITTVMDRVRNPRSTYEENIATPLIPPLSQLKIEQDVSLSSACEQLFPLVKRLLVVSNDTIHPCAELIVSIFPAMTENWRKEHLIAEIIGQDLLNMTESFINQELDESGKPTDHEIARTMANRLHFAVLIFENVSEEYVQWIDSKGMTQAMIKMLEYLVERFKVVDYYQSLVTRVVCWFDFYAKTHRLVLRRKYLQSLTPTLEWFYQAYEEDGMRRRHEYAPGDRKWVPYDASTQKLLNDAFFSGARGIKCLVKRGTRPSKRMDVDFTTMKQTDSTIREIIRTDIPSNVTVSIPDLMASEARLTWPEEENDKLLELSVKILKTGALDPKCSHSMLSFISRLTKHKRNAEKFVDLNGVVSIFRLRARCASTYPYLVSVIIRNCIDDETLLTHVYEKTIRSYIAAPNHPPISMSEYGIKPKEFVDTLNFMAPLSSRNPLVFTEAVNKLARLNGPDIVPMPKEKKPATSTSTAPDAAASTSSAPPTTSASSHTVIDNNEIAIGIVSMMVHEVIYGDFPTVGPTRMLPQDKILTILAEIIKSYPSLAIIVAECRDEQLSALYSLIDTYVSAPVDKLEVTNALKTLIAVISASQNSTKAQDLLVTDVKSALISYSEDAYKVRQEQEKNKAEKESEEREDAAAELEKQEEEILQKISELCSIIIIMCQSCPAPHHHHSDRHHRERLSQNAVMKLFHKKKICADLVRTIHCLQLSSKESLDAVNQILKTLDTLLEGSSASGPAGLSSARSFMEFLGARPVGRERRVLAAGDPIEREIESMINRDGFAFDGEMQSLLRRLQGDDWRAGPPRAGQPGGEDEEGSDIFERERSDSPSEASEHVGDEDVRDDAVETGDGEVEVEMVDVQEDAANPPGELVAVQMEIPQDDGEDDGEDEEDEEDDEDDDNQDAQEGEEDENDREEDDDEDEEDEEDDEGEEQEEAMRVVEPNPEPAGVRRLYDEEDDDDEEDADEDGDSMEDDVARLDLDDDYFDIGAPFDVHRMDDMIFPPSFGRPGVTAFADIFRDEFDFLPPYRTDRRPIPRASHIGGVISEHPLMTRPPAESDVARRPNSALRAEILSMHTRTTLHRQNAIRRTTNEAREIEAISRSVRMGEFPPGRVVIRGTNATGDGGAHASFFDHIFEMRPANVAFTRNPSNFRTYNAADREDRRDVRASQVPTCLERLESYTLSMEPISTRFVTAIVNSYLWTFHTARETQIRKDAEAKAKAKKEADAAKKAAEEKKKAAAQAQLAQAAPVAVPTPEEIGLATPAATNTTNTVSESQAPNASNRGEETSTTPAGTLPEAQQAQEPVVPEEPMETGDDDNAQDALPQSSAATAASSVAGTEEIEAVERQAVEEHVPPIQDHDIPPVRLVEERVPGRHMMDEEFRAILGDIDIPDGVDPAFLVALPEDMRQEVIRDFQRQQRAERASRPVPAAQPVVANAAEPVAEAAEAPAADRAPLIEPIDPVFLNALPPELQEEVLAEHERRVREAEDQLRRQNAPPAQPVEMDGAAVIASLPANERAQVLAEMDEAELAGLPVEMQNEARRARAQHIEPNMLRYHRLLFRGGAGGGPAQVGLARTRTTTRPAAQSGPTIGQHAGNGYQAPTDHPHLLDKESILTLCLLYLVDNNRVPHTRLQKVLRSACVNQTTCDFIVWCLLALLDKASDSNMDDEEMISNVPAWLDSIAVSGVGHNEKAIRISENAQKVSIHSMLAIPMCKNILDLLTNIARSYPGNFLPAILRHGAKPTDVPKQAPSFQQFWNMVQTQSTKFPRSKDWTTAPEQQLEECPLGQMLSSLQKPTMAKSPLKEKVLKVASQIMVTLPMDTFKLLGNDESRKPFAEKLEFVIRVMTTGSCSAEGLSDGLTILSEAMRSFSDSTSTDIYEHLFSAVTKLGSELLPQVDRLILELDDAQKPENASVGGSDQPSTSSKTAQLVVDTNAGGRTAAGRFDGERVVIDGDQNMRLQMSSCKELQLPAVTVLTDKGGSQYAILSALQTLVKVRSHMKAIKKDKIKRAKEAEKKQKEKEKGKETPTNSSVSQPSDTATAASSAASNQPTQEPDSEDVVDEEPRISERLHSLENLWNSLSDCLLRLGKASDPHAVLALQPAAEAFFLVHASQQQKPKSKDSEAKRKESQAAPSTSAAAAVASSVSHDGLREDLDPDTAKLIEFAEKHRQVLNQALRQNNAVLSAGGPFAVLTQFPKLLDFDVKRKYFRKELSKMEPSMPRYRRNDVSVQVSRNRVFSDSFRELFRLRPSDWKNRFYIIFQGEEGQDAGGLLREWFSVITREIFNPNYALFITAPGDMVTYMINKASYINPEHLDYFKFVGRLIAKSVFEHKYLDCYFTRAFYKHILNLPVRYQDLESEDPAFFKSLDFLLQNSIDDLDLDLTFSTEVEEFGVRSVRDLKPNGRKIEVNDANKDEYVKLVCQMKMTGSIRKQLDAFLTGFYEIIPKDLISMFNEQELELLISGLPTVDIDDMAANTDYKGFQKTSTHIQWFWRALRSFEKEDKAKFLQFVTGTSKVPLQGFASLEGMNGVQKLSIHLDSRGGDRLPAAHTCFNQLDLPQYDSYEKLRQSLLLAIRECTEGFGFA